MEAAQTRAAGVVVVNGDGRDESGRATGVPQSKAS
jgi:hypothetical protein